MREAIEVGWPPTDINKACYKCSESLVSHGTASVRKIIRISKYLVWVHGLQSQSIGAGRRSIKSKHSHFIEKEIEAQGSERTCKIRPCWLFQNWNQNMSSQTSSLCASYLKISCTTANKCTAENSLWSNFCQRGLFFLGLLSQDRFFLQELRFYPFLLVKENLPRKSQRIAVFLWAAKW